MLGGRIEREGCRVEYRQINCSRVVEKADKFAGWQDRQRRGCRVVGHAELQGASGTEDSGTQVYITNS